MTLDPLIVELPYLLHVGNRPAAGGRIPRVRGTLSFEGGCLSASLSPQTWAAVANTAPDAALWRLTPHGRRFRLLDLTGIDPMNEADEALVPDREASRWLHDEIADWGLASGLLIHKTFMKIRYPQDKAAAAHVERWAGMTVPDRGAAARVLEMYGMTPDDIAPDGLPVLLYEDRLTGTDELAATIGLPSFCVNRNTGNAMQMTAILFADEFAPEIDGLWWNERYEFCRWAPRAGILQRAVGGLCVDQEAGPGWQVDEAAELALLADAFPCHPAAMTVAPMHPW